VKPLLLIALLLPLSSLAQSDDGYPAPPAGAPTAVCSTDSVDASTPVRILVGTQPVPYAFACGQHPGKPCIGGTLPPGLVVSVAATSGDWSCVSGGDSTSGWVPTARLAELPATPALPLKDWIGWWRAYRSPPGSKGDRILITPGTPPGTLHVSGRAYWYGANDNVHLGELSPTDAKPIGPYLHIVSSPCIVDLHFNPTNRTFTAYDNALCGGMNVRFTGTWARFTPATRPKSKLAPNLSRN
jgi:hypothetical protein